VGSEVYEGRISRMYTWGLGRDCGGGKDWAWVGESEHTKHDSVTVISTTCQSSLRQVRVGLVGRGHQGLFEGTGGGQLCGRWL
jgi:hypothetical protein